ncbi:cytochrome c [Hydrogenophaga sp.]|uniref:c-type cytochrome n=1 Tax=Hydrogenophaga sp. TaxID=1904254 RepID=UPI00260E7FC4|nr:cytochrome c [Hydrogenophaga sp.]MCW5652197.1 cytochrome c [Hydrogenophaga sp.]
MSRALRWGLGALGLLIMALALALVVLARPAAPIAIVSTATQAPPDAHTLQRGRYLALQGNCQGCHTARGGTPYAGGRAITTPYGLVYGSNLTPGAGGLAGWKADDFWRALHHGQSRDGRWLNPVFPINNTTQIAREDSDALFAYLQSLPPVDAAAPPHALRWPYGTQLALRAWRLLYFQPADEQASARDARADDEIRRGAYLVNGLGHCSACHVPRNALSGHRDMLSLAGGPIPAQNWYAPSLLDPAQAGVQTWSAEDVVALFRTGRTGQAIATGPMAEVVQHSTQHWSEQDLRAMASYLRQLPITPAPPRPASEAPQERSLRAGGQRYEQYCAQCHGQQGEGVAVYPPLAGNRAVLQDSPTNALQTVLNGGFGPATAGHPRPFGMPPFVLELNDQDLADVLTFVRTQWGNQAAPVSALDVQQLRGSLGRR